jgi:hypothetical protein
MYLITETGRKRLLRLIARMDNDVDEENFYMGAWLQPSPKLMGAMEDNVTIEEKMITPECGTKACAFGHAALDPELAKEGLSMKWRNGDARFVLNGVEGSAEYIARRFFEMSEDMVTALFLGVSGADTPQDWAGYARGILAKAADPMRAELHLKMGEVNWMRAPVAELREKLNEALALVEKIKQ